jgi:8-oxo-dGTP diphosphatase
MLSEFSRVCIHFLRWAANHASFVGIPSKMGKQPRIEVIARGLLLDWGRVLMCKNIKSGYCYLPGGHVEFAERARDALEREIKEETGLASSIGPLILTTEQCFDDGKRIHHELNTVFHVEHIGTDKAPPLQVPSIEEHIEFVWVDLAELPGCDVRPAEIKAWLMSGGATDDRHGQWLSGFE